MALIPTVIKDDGNRERVFDIYSRLLDDRIIFIDQEINDALASTVTAQLLYLESVDSTRDITVYINSPGGSVTAGFAIYDTMQYVKCDVSTIALGLAASMGAFILSGGAKGKRFALPNSEIMIHQPLGGFQGQASDIMIHAENIQRIKEKMTHMLADSTDGKTDYETMVRLCDRDNFLSSEQALNIGLIDKIVTR